MRKLLCNFRRILLSFHQVVCSDNPNLQQLCKPLILLEMKSPEDGHIWYRWRRGAKTKYIKKINESIADETLDWTHIAYIKFVRMLGTDLSVPIVVGKSNSSSSFDLVYTTEAIKGKENSKSWL